MPRPKPEDDIRIINMTTQEIHPCEVPADSPAQWYKTTRRALVSALRILGDPKTTVFAELLSEMTYANEVHLTHSDIARTTGVSVKTVARVIANLEKNGVVKRIRNGRLMLDPQVMRHGKNAFAGYAKSEWSKLP